MREYQGIIPLTYYTGVPNVGDLANADLISAVGGAPSYQTKDVHLPHLLAVGSVMEWAQPESLIWGTGVMDPVKGVGSASSKNIYSLRGKFSSECLHKDGIITDVPLGDPAYLLPSLLGIAPKMEVGKIGIVPHYVDKSNPFFLKLIHQGARLLDVTTLNVRNFLKEMSTCEFVISSSLHGLIFAEALGIANVWVALGDTVLGNGFKFRDWFSTTRHPQIEVIRPTGLENLAEMSRMCDIHDSEIDFYDLTAAFPRSRLIEAGQAITLQPALQTFDYCRTKPLQLFINIPDIWTLEEVYTTINSAFCRLNPLDIIVCGPKCVNLLDIDFGGFVKFFPDCVNIDGNFLKEFYNHWAEPQKHAIVELGFDFFEIDPAKDLDLALRENPHLEAIIADRKGRRIVYRRPGRWW